MDWWMLEHVNRFATGHDGFEDPVTLYVRVSVFVFAGLLAILFLLVRNHRQLGARTALAAGVSAALALAIAQVVAGVVDRPRPYLAHTHALTLFAGRSHDPSFPSDHTTAAFAIAVAIILRSRRWGALALALAVILAFGRVLVGAHYPSDVIGGAALGALSALVLFAPPFRRLLDAAAARLAATRDHVFGLGRA
jgi:undecaprenyl-diphosphatase